MAIVSGAMSSNGEDSAATNRGQQIRAARKARGWTQRILASEAGVGLRSITRVENNLVEDPHTYEALQQALEIGPYALTPAEKRKRTKLAADGPPLHRATNAELAAEFVRRLAARAPKHPRIREGQMPEGLLDQPGVVSDRPLPDEGSGTDGGA